MFHPGLLHPDQVPANPLVTVLGDRIKFNKQMRELILLLQGIIHTEEGGGHLVASRILLLAENKGPASQLFGVGLPKTK